MSVSAPFAARLARATAALVLLPSVLSAPTPAFATKANHVDFAVTGASGSPLAVARLPLSVLRRPSFTIALAGTRTFAHGGFAGTVTTDVHVALRSTRRKASAVT